MKKSTNKSLYLDYFLVYNFYMNKYKKKINTLRSIIENPVCELNYENNFQLLIAVILSAQCTDKRVNIVTKDLFKKYPTAFELSVADVEEVENIIKSCGFYKSKANNIIKASKQLVDNFNGQVPSEMTELTELAGVGRKTANVVRAVGFNIPSMPVDTHVFRVSNRLGLAEAKDVYTCEKQLLKNIDKEDLIDAHHLLILFGRYYCKAISPKCNECPFIDCKYRRVK